MKEGEQKSGIVTIRRAANPDVDEITRLFYETVSTVNSQYYDADQIAA